MLLCGLRFSSTAQAQETSLVQAMPRINDASGTTAPEPPPAQQSTGTISGTVEDSLGAVAVGATVRLTREGQPDGQEVVSGDNGQFSFARVPSGPFHLQITSVGFVAQELSGTLHPGEFYIVPRIALEVSGGASEVRVNLSPVEVAEEQIKEQEKQRVFGVIPNFYVTYDGDPAPLNAKQKFRLAWKSTTDPVTFVGVGALAGFEQAANDFSGYGQGLQGYAKRYGAGYADVVAGTFIGSAILPSLLKQDPRYFYRGTGSARSRIGYALANGVMCKGDNKQWQPNYSGILGSFATGGISYLYYPASDRHGAGLVVQNSLLRIAESSLAGIFQEFVIRKLTPRAAHMRSQDQYPQ
jgi:Carboxypeptidase regulatory-like domain